MMSGIHFKIFRQKKWQIGEKRLEQCWYLLKLSNEYLELYRIIQFHLLLSMCTICLLNFLEFFYKNISSLTIWLC